MMRTFWKVLFVVFAASSAPLWAQDYPARPVKIVVPYPPGGVPDVLARTVGQRLSESLGQQFVAENRPGAGGITAMMTVVNSPADGYTLVMADPAQTAINAYLYRNIPYDTLRDFAPVSVVASSIQYLASSPKFGSFQDLVAHAKANPGKLTYGSAGIGSIHHIGMESINAALGIKMLHVPYKGTSQSVPAFVAGEVQVVMSSLPTLISHVKAGKAKLLAVTSPKRSPQTPEVPAVAEFIPGYDFTTGIGLLARAGTPAPILSKLGGEIAKAMKHPQTVARLTPLGMTPVGSTPVEYADLIRRDLKKFATAVKISGAKAD
jgi:tripartite-type tricarboxylate transporter receptor subunit TctC